jgi:crotonobetainyl-CoA:carnitine CoA-transferase CaiB-like acyl-CoA transferase
VVELADERTAFAGRLFVGLGARVLRIVPQDARDEGRLAHAHFHAGKSAMRLDLEAPEGQGRLRRLLQDADVLLEARFLDPEELRRARPGLVHVSISPFGREGPRRDWRSTDLVACALGGMTALSGDPEGPPLTPPRGQAHHLAGVNAAIGALLGVLARRRTGRGQLVDVSVHESVAATLEVGAITYIHQGVVHRRGGSAYPHVPHRLFRCRDGWAAGGFGGSPRMWTDLLAWLCEAGAAEDLSDPRWGEEPVRSAGREHVFEVLERFTSRWAKHELATEARRRRLPWAAVATPAEVLDNPQLAARRFFVELSPSPLAGEGRGEQGPVRNAGFAFAFPTAPRPLRLRVPGAPDDRPPAGWRATQSLPPGGRNLSAVGAEGRGGGSLTGLRVLDLTWVLAGPYATRILADHGADVVKVESRHRPDPSRFTSALHVSRDPTHHPDRSGYFNNLNRNKRSITVDLRRPEGVALGERLVAVSDALIENFSAGTLERMGLGERRLRELRPDLVIVRMSGLGQEGPWSETVTYGDTLTAMSGMTAEACADGRPVGITFGLGDMIAGCHAALGALAALEHRARTGRGTTLDLSQLEAVVAQMGTALLEAAGRRREARPWPGGVFRCGDEADRWCAVEVEDAAQMAALRGALGGEPDPTRLAAWARALPAAEVMRRLQRAGVPAGVVQDGRDLVEDDEQLRARGFYVELDHPLAGRFRHEGIVARLGDTPGAVVRPAPLLGQHTREVLEELLGMTAQEIEGLRARHVLE